MKKRTLLILLMGLPLLTVLWAWLRPRDAEFYYARGVERLEYEDMDGKGGDIDGALADFNHVIRLNPQFADAYRRRGQIAEMNGESELALADFSRAIELAPKEARNYVSRACYWESRTNLNEAIADLDRAAEVDPRDERIFGQRARLKRTAGDYSGMVADLAHAQEVFLPIPTNALNIKWQVPGNDPKRTANRLIRMHDRALQLNPDFSLGYYYRGALKQLANDLDGALEDFRRCSEFSDAHLQDHAAIHIWLVQMQRGETNAATMELLTHFGDRLNQPAPEWEVQIARFLVNQIGEPEFQAAIGKANAEWEQSEFWYYSAKKHLLAGDKEKAAECFSKSWTTRTRPYVVAVSAQIELGRLNQ